jgi:hypothetical protein
MYNCVSYSKSKKVGSTGYETVAGSGWWQMVGIGFGPW